MRTGLVALLTCVLSFILSTSALAQNQNKAVADNWEDFVHYIKIARPELALKVGDLLLQASDADLLDAVEASRHAETFSQTLEVGAKIESIKEVSIKVARKIQDARIKRARDPERIKQDIQRLTQGERARRNALERLRAGGQFTAPLLLKTLMNPEEAKQHEEVLNAIRVIGRDIVYPMAEALHHLEPVQITQVAQVLGEIGYPRALPYLKEVMEDQKVDAYARGVVTKAFETIAKSQALPDGVTAAQLYLILGRNFYAAASDTLNVIPGTDALDNSGVVWSFVKDAGLVEVHVPGPIFGDVLSHRAARRALQLDPTMDQALSLWLMANLRRENRLPAGGKDDSYPPAWQPPSFYIRAASPLRAHDVLERALNDHDSDLALDAIAALSDIAGTDALINKAGTIQPMLRALGYPDRRVRYTDAFALTNARPKAKFDGSFRVVPVLAEAVRQTENKYALIIASSQDNFNKINEVLKAAGYNGFGGLSLEQSIDELNRKPGIDIIVTDLEIAGVEKLYQQSISDYKLAAVPLVVLGKPGTVIEVNRQALTNRRLFATEWLATDDAAKAKPALDAARAAYAGKEVSAEEATKFASKALTLLRELAMSRDEVFNVMDALPALIEALKDTRPEIVKQAGTVLALLNSVDAQKALADAALDTSKAEDVRVSILGSLAESATHIGTKLTEAQLEGIHGLVAASKGDLALAAARAYGALAQPTSKVVDLIVK